MRFLSVFAGIGGFDLGLERANWQCAGQVEIEPFCNAVLEKHWPNVWRWRDVKTLTGKLISDNCGRVDAIVGGPPCQPASVAGNRRGTADDRWLWPDFLRVVSEVNPMWVLAENPRGVASIRVEGLQFTDWLARELETRGYELLPIELAAEDVGAPHRRERVWFVGYAGSVEHNRLSSLQREEMAAIGRASQRYGDGLAVTARELFNGSGTSGSQWRSESSDRHCVGVGLADSNGARSQEHSRERGDTWQEFAPIIRSDWPARPGEPQHEWEERRVVAAESQMGGAVNGVSSRLVGRRRVAALKALGNAVVPQCAEVLGRMINRFMETA
jgi:DNA (cytosine-5)-methyltransferase 1